nr:phosphopantetheine-binding protein [Pseudomonas syringae]
MIWEKCLGHKRFGLNDSLFDIGGDSLIAVKVTALFRDAFPIRLTVRQLYKSSTINKLAKIVEGASN